ncbi:D-glycero-beta-D-manno-heptose 1-phosphate adenylyltransferase [bacterium]|nr:D-glycero-beta-D-manno-heptose 1-phosphate adenylyltransferase [bacterium]|tara:strand:+ start:1360 stop:1956 length:597 start_codon:yes stop_codon:yes gene_type:complete
MTLQKILEFGSNFDNRFIPDYDDLGRIVSELRKVGKRVVLTQGVYDLVHEGHALYLQKARSYGDILIVGVDTDELTQQRKGLHRPIVPQKERLSMLSHLRYVDIVTLRNAKDEIGALIKLVCPDVLITSATTKDFPEEDMKVYESCCGNIITLPPQATISTTARIRNLEIGGADRLADELHKRIPAVVADALNALNKG